MSKLDYIYRRLLLTKFFTKGWGKPENLKRLFEFRKTISNRETCQHLVPKDYPVHIDKDETFSDCRILEGHFVSPFTHYLPGIMPKEVEMAWFQVVLPKEWKYQTIRPMCLHLAGTGDHYYWRRRTLMARPLIKEAGIGSILLENPYYGMRKPKSQLRSSLHNVSDLFVMGGALILESQVLLHWCEKNGWGPLGITGISMGGHMASLAATNWPKPLALIPCLSWSTASGVFTKGVMSGAIPWEVLQSQYLSDSVYQDEISKLIHSPEDSLSAIQHRDAYAMGKLFARRLDDLQKFQQENSPPGDKKTVLNSQENVSSRTKSLKEFTFAESPDSGGGTNDARRLMDKLSNDKSAVSRLILESMNRQMVPPEESSGSSKETKTSSVKPSDEDVMTDSNSRMHVLSNLDVTHDADAGVEHVIKDDKSTKTHGDSLSVYATRSQELREGQLENFGQQSSTGTGLTNLQGSDHSGQNRGKISPSKTEPRDAENAAFSLHSGRVPGEKLGSPVAEILSSASSIRTSPASQPRDSRAAPDTGLSTSGVLDDRHVSNSAFTVAVETPSSSEASSRVGSPAPTPLLQHLSKTVQQVLHPRRSPSSQDPLPLQHAEAKAKVSKPRQGILGGKFGRQGDQAARSGKSTEALQREAANFMRGVMDECTHLGNFSIPVDTRLIIIVAAKQDAYVPRANVMGLDKLWPGSEVRYIDRGHISAFLLNQDVFRKAIIDAFDRQIRFHCNTEELDLHRGGSKSEARGKE